MNNLKPRARQLRKDQTQAERILWDVLRNRKFHNLKFRRQVPVDRYIVDFICVDKKLIIELDGPHHESQQDYDNKRTQILENLGYRLVRFRNEDFIDNFSFVLEKLEFFVNPNT